MMRFVLQSGVRLDFIEAMRDAMDFWRWRDGDCCGMCLFEDGEEGTLCAEGQCCPVGSVEYVESKEPGVPHIPLNVPASLRGMAGREVRSNLVSHYGMFPGVDFGDCNMLFAKSADRVKGWSGWSSEWHLMPDGLYQVSEEMEVLSEWRCFVMDGKLLDVRRYSGDFSVFPYISEIRGMLEAWTDAPPACTLDVAVNDEGTFVMEAHDFYSCGLYGFRDHQNLPLMFWRSYRRRMGKG